MHLLLLKALWDRCLLLNIRRYTSCSLLLLELHLCRIDWLHSSINCLLKRVDSKIFRLNVFTLVLNNETFRHITILIWKSALLRYFLRKFSFFRRLLVIKIDIVHVLISV